jgi:hypothetical protein
LGVKSCNKRSFTTPNILYSQVPEHIQHFKYFFMGLHGHTAPVPWMRAAVIPTAITLRLLILPRTRQNETLQAVASAAGYFSLWIEKGLGLIGAGSIPLSPEKITVPSCRAGRGDTVGIRAFGAVDPNGS